MTGNLFSAVSDRLTDAFPYDTVSAGPAPAEADAGSIYIYIEKFSSDNLFTVKIRRFCGVGASGSDAGASVAYAVFSIELGGSTYEAVKYECRAFDRYTDVTMQYQIPAEYVTESFESGGSAAYSGSDMMLSAIIHTVLE